MNAAIGHWGHRFAMAVTSLATLCIAMASPAASRHWRASATIAPSTWSLLPQPADVRLAQSVVKLADGDLVGVRGADLQQVQAIADRFIQLVADTRGLQLHAA